MFPINSIKAGLRFLLVCSGVIFLQSCGVPVNVNVTSGNQRLGEMRIEKTQERAKPQASTEARAAAQSSVQIDPSPSAPKEFPTLLIGGVKRLNKEIDGALADAKCAKCHRARDDLKIGPTMEQVGFVRLNPIGTSEERLERSIRMGSSGSYGRGLECPPNPDLSKEKIGRVVKPTLAAGAAKRLIVHLLDRAGGKDLAYLSSPFETAEMPDDKLQKRYACTNCHASNRRLVGPAYSEIQDYYKSRRGEAKIDDVAFNILVGEIGVSKWGKGPHVPTAYEQYGALNETDARRLVKWILFAKH